LLALVSAFSLSAAKKEGDQPPVDGGDKTEAKPAANGKAAKP
jgi:hypothetical protein